MSSRSLSVKTPFGLLGIRMVAPADVPSGLACGCICPGCGARLVARKGSLAWCFAHHGTAGTVSCLETAIHAAGKQVVLDSLNLIVPSFSVQLEARTADGEILQVAETLSPARRVRFDCAQAEVCFGAVRADVVGYRGTRSILIEIFVTHQVDRTKQGKLDQLGTPVLEIDLSDLPERGAALGLEAVRERVVDDAKNKRWLVYPGAEKVRVRLRAELDEIIAERDRQAEKAAKMKRLRDLEAMTLRADGLARYRALPGEEKERRIRLTLGIRDIWPDYLNQERFDTPVLALPAKLWQAMLYEYFVHRNRSSRKEFSVAELEPWADEWVGCTLADGRAVGPVLRGYVAYLAARGFLIRSYSGEREGPTRYKPPLTAVGQKERP